MRVLRDYFQGLVDRGAERVVLSPAARTALRAVVATKRTLPLMEEALPKPDPIVLAPQYVHHASAPPPPPTPAPRSAPLPLEERTAQLAALKAAAAKNASIRELGTLRETMVFAVGDPMAEILFVGEAPGAEEEVQQEPFVGPAGQLLTKMIVAMGLERSQVYISNICKFRPKIPDQGTSNRRPTAPEIAANITFIEQEIDLIQPKVIVALGATAAEGLLGMPNVVVGRVRAKFHDYRGYPVMLTYHPSYLLHNPSMSERRKVWEDLLKVMERVGMPVSEKQRGFFLPKNQG